MSQSVFKCVGFTTNLIMRALMCVLRWVPSLNTIVIVSLFKAERSTDARLATVPSCKNRHSKNNRRGNEQMDCTCAEKV